MGGLFRRRCRRAGDGRRGGGGGAAAAPSWIALSRQLAPRGAATDFTPHGTQPGLSYGLAESLQCEGCHAGSGDAAAFRPVSTWGGSMMANATRDPLFFAALDVANHDVPGVGDYCLRCHTSRGWYRGHVVKAGYGAPDNDVALGASACLLDGGYDWADDVDNDYSGVSCHFCHRLSDSGPGGEAAMIGNADAWLDDAACANPDSDEQSEPCRRGPYSYSSPSPQPPHAWQASPYHAESGLCGLCHDVTSPDAGSGPLKTLKLADGTDTALPFPIERTYSEWQRSRYAQAPQTTCQSCHMPESDAADASACSLPGYPNRSGALPVHEFAGGNTWVPAIIKGEYADTSAVPGAYGGVGRADAFDRTIERARDKLAQAASVQATITAFTAPLAGAPGSIDVGVKVTNLSGHKLPTGYAEGRRMWLDVQVHDANGALVFESGAYDARNAVLAQDPQLHVYEVLQGVWNHRGDGQCDVEDAGGAPMFHFVLNDCIAKDNRIPPLGFAPATSGDPQGYELRPVGAAYAETAPGSGVLVNYDLAAYHAGVPVGVALPLTATARLYYQTSSREYIEFLRDQAVANATPGENAMCAAAADPMVRPRPFVVGPQDRTRGEYVYQLWSGRSSETIFADGFDAAASGYGKSPPELMQVASATTTGAAQPGRGRR